MARRSCAALHSLAAASCLGWVLGGTCSWVHPGRLVGPPGGVEGTFPRGCKYIGEGMGKEVGRGGAEGVCVCWATSCFFYLSISVTSNSGTRSRQWGVTDNRTLQQELRSCRGPVSPKVWHPPRRCSEKDTPGASNFATPRDLPLEPDSSYLQRHSPPPRRLCSGLITGSPRRMPEI